MLISIDHGNKLIKTVNHEPFTSGLQESEIRPYGEEFLKYKGKYYMLSDQRIPYHRDKTEDERFFILTLFAVAYELEATGKTFPASATTHIDLAVGLPPAHFSAQRSEFIKYFSHRGKISFEFRTHPYEIVIHNVGCYPQSYAASMTVLQTLLKSPKMLVLDIGGYTADYLVIRDGTADRTECDSLENGVILLYNKIKSRANAELDLKLEESEIDAVLKGRKEHVDAQVAELVERQALEFVNDLLSTLRERGVELKSGKVVITGGGSILLRRLIEQSGKVNDALYSEDIRANARGFELLYQIEQRKR